jgi:arylsulfatase A-like enzyme
MNRRKFLELSLSAAPSAVFLPTLNCKNAESSPPNILFIMADDHTSQAWGCYGSPLQSYTPTKNIDRLRSEGALLQNCFCTNSICVPSRATILTGQYSHIHGARRLDGRLEPGQNHVAKVLGQNGYETAVIGKWHLKEQPEGFDYYSVLRGQGKYHDPVFYQTGKEWQGKGTVVKGHSTDVITNQSLQWLQQRKNSSSPFCLMCHFKAVDRKSVV